MKIAILLVGHMRSWKFCKYSFINTFNSDNDIDIFVHTYDCILNFHPYIQNLYSIQNNFDKSKDQDIIDQLGVYIKNIVIENQDTVDEEIKRTNNLPINNDTYSQYRKNKLCNDIKSEHEKENNFEYDIVIKTRFDIMFSSDISDIIRYIKNTDPQMEKIHISRGPSVQPCDQIIICSSKNMTEFTNKLISIQNPDEVREEKYSPHEWFELCIGDKINKIPFLYSTRVISS